MTTKVIVFQILMRDSYDIILGAEGGARWAEGNVELPNLRRVRERRLLTQRELATRAGLTQATVLRIERGTTRARISTVRRLADALGVRAKELMGDAEPESGKGCEP